MNANNTLGRPGPLLPGHGPGPQAWPSSGAVEAGQQDALPQQQAPAGGRASKPWALATAGTAAAAVPAAPGLALAATGHPQAVPLLMICSGVIGMVSIIANAVVRIHDSMQQTRRLQIQHAGRNAIAAAMARCIDATHDAAQDVPAGQRTAEAASVRASAGQAVTEMMPAVLAATGQQAPSSAGPRAGTLPQP